MLVTWQLYQGDALQTLKQLESESVHCCVTSPPYWGLRDYGVDGQLGLEPTPKEYITKMVEVFREVKRVLRPDGTLWVNMGDSYASDPGKGYYGNDPKNPAKGTARARTLSLAPKQLVGIPWRLAFALQEDGWWLRSDIIWSKPNPMPESVTDRPTKAHEYIFLLSKSSRYFYDYEAIKEPCVQDEYANGFRGGAYCNNSTFNNSEGGKRTNTGNLTARDRVRGSKGVINNPPNSALRIKVPAGWDVKPGAHGTINREGRTVGEYNEVPVRKSGNKERKINASDRLNTHMGSSIPWEGSTRNKRTVWTVPTHAFPEAHFATFPPDLIVPCILAGCPEGGTVLDPFAGGGTTLFVAEQIERNSIGIELNPDYCEIIRRRMGGLQPSLFQVQ